jgi:predicted DNA-binding transcriptional regulator YafY
MARNAEVIRQWQILRAIDGARNGIGIGKLASQVNVCTRTIRRDLQALDRAGFPIYDDKVNGTGLWKLNARPFHQLEQLGLGLMELCALYLSRTMMDTLGAAPLMNDAERAFIKIEKALPPGCRTFLDHLPRVLKAKSSGPKIQDERRVGELLGRAMDATLLHRRATMRYMSASQRGVQAPVASSVLGCQAPVNLRVPGTYLIEPHRIVYAHGGIYLIAWVPAYDEMRTFAAERIETFGVMDETFEPRPLPVEPFADSMGVNTGTPEKIVLEFEADAARHVRTRLWHKSQELEPLAHGRLRLTLKVCNDYALRAWVLGFGGDALVVWPNTLVRDVFEAADRTRRRYLRKEDRLEMLRMKAG